MQNQSSTSTVNHGGGLGNSNVQSNILLDPLYLFTCALFLKVKIHEKRGKNTILSPLNIHQALNLLLLGADQGSETESELLEVLFYDKAGNPNYINYHEAYRTLNADRSDTKATINQIWSTIVSKNGGAFQTSYQENVQKYYNSSVAHVDDSQPETKLRLLNKVNKWAKEVGFNGPLIEHKTLDAPFAAMLLTAIRIEAWWYKDFDVVEKTNIFYNFGEKDQLVKRGPTLSQRESYYSYVEFTSSDKIRYEREHTKIAEAQSEALESLAELNFHAVRLDLRDGFDFTIFEPLDWGNGLADLNKLIAGLLAVDSNYNRTRLSKAFEVLDSNKALNKIRELTFPQFKFENHIDLKGVLKSMGLAKVFKQNESQMSKMMEFGPNKEHNSLYIDEVKHHALIEVDKFGLKAAAVTVTHMGRKAGFGHSIDIKIEHPFMFVLRHKKLPMFIGQLVAI